MDDGQGERQRQVSQPVEDEPLERELFATRFQSANRSDKGVEV